MASHPPQPEALPSEPAPDEGKTVAREAVGETGDAHDRQMAPGVPPLPPQLAPLVTFWIKINNNWIFNLAGLLAYNFILTLFPILLLLLGGWVPCSGTSRLLLSNNSKQQSRRSFQARRDR